MSSRQSPLKRKHSEYHDPDYLKQEEIPTDGGNEHSGYSASFAAKRQHFGQEFKSNKDMEGEHYYDKVRQVIEREFKREIVIKQQQLDEIDERLEKAKTLLERLRYGIVSAYYKKQEIPITAADATAIRGPNCLFEREDKGPQMPLHPSIKKLIGKRPRDISDVIRTCPKRTAAQNAVQTIRAKSQIQKREERKLKKIIRDQGIVIDHSKQNVSNSDVMTLVNAAAQNIVTNKQTIASKDVKKDGPIDVLPPKCISGEALNDSRLNNKTKHLIVVGNTSKYIGNESERDLKPQFKNLTHKWLVYVQSKDIKQPIERFVKKVRFYLHHSYRPNDVVDVEAPPFQISRRGWGEFPIRVQLFFHQEYHQNPTQVVHNIKLDQSLAGIQKMGDETFLEIWLRNVKTLNSPIKEKHQENKITKKSDTPTKCKSYTSGTEDFVDDNLLEFLNKIEASHCSISADIEKIQPTVVVTEPLAVKLKTLSPEKIKINAGQQRNSPIKAINTSLNVDPCIFEKIQNNLFNITSNSAPTTASSIIESTSLKTQLFSNSSLTSKPVTTLVQLPANSTQVKLINPSNTAANTFTNIPPLRQITTYSASSTINVVASNLTQSNSVAMQKTSVVLNKDSKMLMPSPSVTSAVQTTILPIVNNIAANQPQQQLNKSLSSSNKSQVGDLSTETSLPPTTLPKKIYQKKLVQVVDSTGKVKYIQMLVATNFLSSAQNTTVAFAASKLITTAPSSVISNTVTSTTQITKTITTPLLKPTNGVHLTPAITTKPNIFKIVPENMQNKPQIITFSTTANVATPNAVTQNAANKLSSANYPHLQQQQQHYQATTSNTQTTTSQITTTPTRTITQANNAPLSVGIKPQKSNGSVPTKNVVFQKEGKLCIIDPEQIKYKQQQKNQVSLLKPQITLLKQQQQQQQKSTPTTLNCSTSVTKPIAQIPSNNSAPPVHYGLKQQRINSMNALQLSQMKTVIFKKQFLRQEFSSMRSAVEFLLRRLKLIVCKESLASAFPFVCHTLNEFHSLTAFKQRACEWLRAKNISRMIRNHKDLQRINKESKENFWSTKEIATFARLFAYTPPIKSLPRPGHQKGLQNEDGTKSFTDLIKSELKQEHNLQYDTLTDQQKVKNWANKVRHTLKDYEHNEDERQIIDVDSKPKEENNDNKSKQELVTSTLKHYPLPSLDVYLPPPPQLEHASKLVSSICNDLGIKLTYEELDFRVYHLSTQTVLAQCLQLFIEKIVRQSIALKDLTSGTDTICTISPQNLANLLSGNSELEFLTNSNIGSTTLAEYLAINKNKP